MIFGRKCKANKRSKTKFSLSLYLPINSSCYKRAPILALRRKKKSSSIVNLLKAYYIPIDNSEKNNLDLSKRRSDEKKSHSEQKSFYLVTTQSNPDSAPDLKNDIPISKNWKVAEKAGTLCLGLKQLWAPHKLKDKNWFSFLDYQEVGASRSGNLTLSWPCGLDCSQTCSILKRIVWGGNGEGGEEKPSGTFCARW